MGGQEAFLPRHVQPPAGTPGNSSCSVKSREDTGSLFAAGLTQGGMLRADGSVSQSPPPPPLTQPLGYHHSPPTRETSSSSIPVLSSALGDAEKAHDGLIPPLPPHLHAPGQALLPLVPGPAAVEAGNWGAVLWRNAAPKPTEGCWGAAVQIVQHRSDSLLHAAATGSTSLNASRDAGDVVRRMLEDPARNPTCRAGIQAQPGSGCG